MQLTWSTQVPQETATPGSCHSAGAMGGRCLQPLPRDLWLWRLADARARPYMDTGSFPPAQHSGAYEEGRARLLCKQPAPSQTHEQSSAPRTGARGDTG